MWTFIAYESQQELRGFSSEYKTLAIIDDSNLIPSKFTAIVFHATTVEDLHGCFRQKKILEKVEKIVLFPIQVIDLVREAVKQELGFTLRRGQSDPQPSKTKWATLIVNKTQQGNVTENDVSRIITYHPVKLPPDNADVEFVDVSKSENFIIGSTSDEIRGIIGKYHLDSTGQFNVRRLWLEQNDRYDEPEQLSIDPFRISLTTIKVPIFEKYGSGSYEQHDGYVLVTWNQAQEFVQNYTKNTGHLVRLPTEIEWELAVIEEFVEYSYGVEWCQTIFSWINKDREIPLETELYYPYSSISLRDAQQVDGYEIVQRSIRGWDKNSMEWQKRAKFRNGAPVNDVFSKYAFRLVEPSTP